MSDTDTLTLKEAGDAVMEVDVRYRKLDNIDDKEDLKPERDKAFNAYSKARLKLLEEAAAGRVAIFLTRLVT